MDSGDDTSVAEGDGGVAVNGAGSEPASNVCPVVGQPVESNEDGIEEAGQPIPVVGPSVPRLSSAFGRRHRFARV